MPKMILQGKNLVSSVFFAPMMIEIHPARITPIHKPKQGHLEREQPYFGDFLAMIINHLRSFKKRHKTLVAFAIIGPPEFPG